MNHRWPGSKHHLAKTILSLAPSGWREYREPFAGNCSILWEMETRGRRLWINDKNPTLYNYYTRLTGPTTEFIDEVDLLVQQAVMPGEVFNLWLSMKPRFRQDDPVALLILSRLAFGEMVRLGRKDSCSYDRKYLGSMNCLNRRRLLASRRILLAAKQLKITCGDYAPMLTAPGRDVWLYLDPTYYINSPDHNGCHGQPLYDYILDRDQHIELRDRLLKCKHKFLMTIGNSVFENYLYRDKGFRIIASPYRDHASRRSRTPRYCELIVMNY